MENDTQSASQTPNQKERKLPGGSYVCQFESRACEEVQYRHWVGLCFRSKESDYCPARLWWTVVLLVARGSPRKKGISLQYPLSEQAQIEDFPFRALAELTGLHSSLALGVSRHQWSCPVDWGGCISRTDLSLSETRPGNDVWFLWLP